MSQWHTVEQAPEDGIYWWTGCPKYMEPILCQMTTKVTSCGKQRVWKSLIDDRQDVLKAGAGGWWCKVTSPIFDGQIE